jgi:hypothetical protein
MKTPELVFKTHHLGRGTQARIDFPNGYGASVVTGSMFYTDTDHPYELAVMLNGHLCYDTPITSDVCGHLTESDVDSLLEQIEALPRPS